MTGNLAGERPPEDLTARARIRDAALCLFAERGIEGASIRDIAAVAGVSPGLVRHHFGSKEALRNACDAYAVDQAQRLQDQTFAEGRLADRGFLASVHPSAMLLQSYLVRSMMDGSDAGEAMFDTMVQIGEQWLATHQLETSDLRAYAAALVAMKLSVFLLTKQLSRVLGVDITTPEGHARITGGMLDAFTHPLLTPEQAAQAHAAMNELVDRLDRSRRAG